MRTVPQPKPLLTLHRVEAALRVADALRSSHRSAVQAADGRQAGVDAVCDHLACMFSL